MSEARKGRAWTVTPLDERALTIRSFEDGDDPDRAIVVVDHDRAASASSEELFAAFIAGFEASGEGFNGEYVDQRFRGSNGVPAEVFISRLRDEFDIWNARQEFDRARE